MEEKENGTTGCVGVIVFFVGWYLLSSLVMNCKSSLARMCEDEPPYFGTDNYDYFHKSECPYVSEDNVGGCYDSKSEAYNDGLSPCPHCFE